MFLNFRKINANKEWKISKYAFGKVFLRLENNVWNLFLLINIRKYDTGSTAQTNVYIKSTTYSVNQSTSYLV
jgi:hypothetical protein